jgi:DNA-binding response OmpR family regulator
MNGYRVIECSDSAAAVEAIEGYSGEIQLILTDAALLVEEGSLQPLSVIAKMPDIRLIYMTDQCDESDFASGFSIPSFSLIRKPFSPDDLNLKVREALSR